ncbi:MAG: NAD(P)-dependent dehydrogenase (short-subunit alcohol dehydrogenase family) [Acidimicrobiales bacterium]|jgi:NAD(P)-dependent dehydrogenase (short-subunit alcohol dehydrogenase family)
MGRLDDKVAMISGAGTGIGRQAALMFAREGAQVMIAEINTELGQETETMVREAGGQATFVRTDVTDDAQVAAAVEATVEAYGKLNVLYNCAGGSIPEDGPVTDVDLDVWDFTMSLDLKGPFLCCRHGIPKMIEAGGGTVVNMSSTAALMGMRMHVYSAAKGGVISLTTALARQYSRSGVRVNAICPGYVLTDRVTERFSVAGPGGEASQEEKARQRYPFGVGQPEEIANIALFLASDESRMINGASIPADGGMSYT